MASLESRKKVAPFNLRGSLERAIRWYANGVDFTLPRPSPVFAHLSALPPILLQVGDDEILLSDSVRVAEQIGESGGRVELSVWEGMWHNWPMYVGLPEAIDALAEVSEFLGR